jgi:hypothetical protein
MPITERRIALIIDELIKFKNVSSLLKMLELINNTIMNINILNISGIPVYTLLAFVNESNEKNR